MNEVQYAWVFFVHVVHTQHTYILMLINHCDCVNIITSTAHCYRNEVSDRRKAIADSQ